MCKGFFMGAKICPLTKIRYNGIIGVTNNST